MSILKGRYHKQELLAEIGEEGQSKLARSTVVVMGCGALGSVISNSMVRSGVGTVRIVDRDFIELDNLPRQVLFDEEDIKRNLPKVIAAAEKLRRINSEITIDPVVADINSGNIEALVEGADLVMDGTDNFETRFLINDVCFKQGVPWVYGGVAATFGMVYALVPGRTPCFRCFINQVPMPGDSPTCHTIGVLGTAVNVVASLEVTEGIKILTGNIEELMGKLLYLDIWRGLWHPLKINKGKKLCPVCDKKEFEFLSQKRGTQVVCLRGQNAIQITPQGTDRISFNELTERLVPHGKVVSNEYMIRFTIASYEFTVFRDGRTIIAGVADEAEARKLYSKYIGL